MKKKKIPLRMCTICKQQAPKRELVRLAKSADGRVELDESGKKPGRGFYVCQKAACLEQASKGGRLEKSAGVKLDEGLRGRLKERAASHTQGGPLDVAKGAPSNDNSGN